MNRKPALFALALVTALAAPLAASQPAAAKGGSADGTKLARKAPTGSVAATPTPADAGSIERGRYLVTTSGCNDCHTPGYMERSGNVPAADWLVGVPVGFQGPWGTTFPANLRQVVHSMGENQWLAHARKPTRPPMPWFNVKEMNDADLRAIYRFARSLGPAGGPVPAYVAPGEPVSQPFFVFVPQNLPVKKASR